MDADALPAFLWEGDPPGRNYKPEDMTDGIFKGYLPVRVHFSFFLCFVIVTTGRLGGYPYF